jgi:PPK2 family polyphosphate:nucleotide phosphotransferase
MARPTPIKLAKLPTIAPKNLDKDKIKNLTKGYLDELNTLQNLMYAESKHSLLVIIQGMDASGKDGLIRDVFTNVNPLGIQVKSWKAPTPDELAHDFLWRIHQNTPAKGMIQLHNRSHYEDILVTRVHHWIDDKTAQKRIQSITNFEKHLFESNQTTILKFYLHISHDEQLMRLNERMQIPEKMWKYNENDLKESELWDDYMKYYEEAITLCNNPEWIIVPSDQNWYKNFVVAETLVQTLKSFQMKFPGMKKG